MASFRECVKKIIKGRKDTVLNDYKLFCAYLSDLGAGYPEERDFIINVCDKEYLSFFAKMQGTEEDRVQTSKRASKYLIDKKKIDASFAKYISEEMSYGTFIMKEKPEIVKTTGSVTAQESDVKNSAESKAKEASASKLAICGALTSVTSVILAFTIPFYGDGDQIHFLGSLDSATGTYSALLFVLCGIIIGCTLIEARLFAAIFSYAITGAFVSVVTACIPMLIVFDICDEYLIESNGLWIPTFFSIIGSILLTISVIKARR